ncbi:ABC transporter permease [Halocatena pleomorpha]|uniref:ABC transporter permease n=1 Tax=Halocatena pleomorpha TaxID=1785090 RepID=A0A3P3RCD3_9EURY|nr:ABC transporter permease [Halocatena pleomorpha]RRJ31045.1 ABC transporter permease [Halocatena pleomorpha]
MRELPSLGRKTLGGVVVLALVGGVLSGFVDKNALSSTLRLSVPIAFAALGGIFAEKSGVINIGLEGHLIISAFVGIYATNLTGNVWIGFAAGVLASTLFAVVFAIVCLEFRADQIIAGLAVWLVALGLAPFLSTVIYESVNAGSAGFDPITIPGLSEIPVLGALFDAKPPVYLMLLAVVGSWYVLNYTAFGRWVHASGENPQALDTAGVSVKRVRYASVLLSGVLAGIGGASLSLSLGEFSGNGQTMVDGRGFIAIVVYLLGNYNPIGTFLSTTLFAGLQTAQIQLQSGYLPSSLVQTIPYITVIIVLAGVGRTRTPDAAGDHYESGEE